MFRFIGKIIAMTIKLIIILALLSACIFAYARFIEPNMLVTSEVEIDSHELLYAGGGHASEDTDSVIAPVKVVLFGDTHIGFNYDIEDLHKVVDRINEESPDIIVFSGDLIDNLNTYTGDTALVSEALSELSAPGGKYAVHGNHDYELSGKDTYSEIMRAGGFDVLINESLFLPEYNINVFGITDCLIGDGDVSVLTAAGPDTFNIVVCHEPDVFNRVTEMNVSLMLSGHSHGGQVNIPLFTDPFLPPLGNKYVKGLYEEGENTLYVTKGIGTTKLPLRFMAKPEIVLLTIE